MRGLWFFASFRIFFPDNMRVIIFIFFVAQSAIFFSEFNIRLYDKNSETDFFSLHQNQNIFFSNIGNQNICLEKNHYSPPSLEAKWSVPNFLLKRKTVNFSSMIRLVWAKAEIGLKKTFVIFIICACSLGTWCLIRFTCFKFQKWSLMHFHISYKYM